jgi:2-amino-4-hydroxy-6-hydroxymethyldihydropteridine diphosphokinase
MILIGIGANLPRQDGTAPYETCRACIPLLRAISGLSFVALSSWYRSASIPKGDAPDYCNGIIRLEGDIEPLPLLDLLQDIERQFGRERSVPYASRTLDLDIIDLNGTIRATPDPVLPHPRAHLRAFVLRPILDVAPAWRHPICRSSVTTLLAELPPQNIRPWPEDLR